MTVHDGFLLHHPVVTHHANRVVHTRPRQQYIQAPNVPLYRAPKAPKTAPTVRKVYGENTSDNSDYGELRAIVRRIEMGQNESSSNASNSDQLFLKSSPSTNSATSSGGTQNQKKMVFDYVPASVMMKK